MKLSIEKSGSVYKLELETLGRRYSTVYPTENTKKVDLVKEAFKCLDEIPLTVSSRTEEEDALNYLLETFSIACPMECDCEGTDCCAWESDDASGDEDGGIMVSE